MTVSQGVPRDITAHAAVSPSVGEQDRTAPSIAVNGAFSDSLLANARHFDQQQRAPTPPDSEAT